MTSHVKVLDKSYLMLRNENIKPFLSKLENNITYSLVQHSGVTLKLPDLEAFSFVDCSSYLEWV